VLPVAFYSRQLQGSKRRYAATELEALAVCEAVKHFQHYLYGATFQLYTDHKPLTSHLTSKSLNRRLQGMALKLMTYDLAIVYRKGVANNNADGLSRQSWETEIDKSVHVPVQVDHSVSGLSKRDCGAGHRQGKNNKKRRKEEEKQ